MKKIFVPVVLLVMLLTAPAMAASTCYQKLDCKGSACTLRLSWTTDASGNFAAFKTMEVNGWIDGVETDPSGAAAPTDNYDITMANQLVSTIGAISTTTTRNIGGDTGTWTGGEVTTAEDGVLSNRDTAVAEFTRFLTNGCYGGTMNFGPLLVDISNAGVSKSGVINIQFFKTD